MQISRRVARILVALASGALLVGGIYLSLVATVVADHPLTANEGKFGPVALEGGKFYEVELFVCPPQGASANATAVVVSDIADSAHTYGGAAGPRWRRGLCYQPVVVLGITPPSSGRYNVSWILDNTTLAASPHLRIVQRLLPTPASMELGVALAAAGIVGAATVAMFAAAERPRAGRPPPPKEGG